jgi:hypothetical protein
LKENDLQKMHFNCERLHNDNDSGDIVTEKPHQDTPGREHSKRAKQRHMFIDLSESPADQDDAAKGREMLRAPIRNRTHSHV